MMKFALATLLAATSVNAQSVEFADGVPFTGFDGNSECEAGTEFLTGTALSLTLVDENAVCEETEYTIDDETFTLYTGIVLSCLSTGISKNYYFCNEGCTKCDDEPFQFGTESWDDDGPCYSNSATVGTEDETMVLTSSWSFDSSADKDDIQAFLDFAMENTCIGDGPPTIEEEEEEGICLTYSDYIPGTRRSNSLLFENSVHHFQRSWRNRTGQFHNFRSNRYSVRNVRGITRSERYR